MWLHCPWYRSAREAAGSRKESDPLSPALALRLSQFCTWRGKRSPPHTWSVRWRRADWLRLLSGLTLKGLGHLSFVDFSLWLDRRLWLGRLSPQQGFPASPGQALACEKEPKTSAGSGTTSIGSFAIYDPGSSSWRTPQISLLADLNTFSGLWPKSGSMRNGMCFERPTSAPRIRGRAGGVSVSLQNSVDSYGKRLWPTATVGDSKASGGRYPETSNAHPGTSLTDACLSFRLAPATKHGDAFLPLDLSTLSAATIPSATQRKASSPRRSQEKRSRRLSPPSSPARKRSGASMRGGGDRRVARKDPGMSCSRCIGGWIVREDGGAGAARRCSCVTQASELKPDSRSEKPKDPEETDQARWWDR